MFLSDLEKNDKAIIKRIVNAPTETKRRFNSFGIFKDVEITVDEVTLSKNTISIIVEDTKIALRIDEARYIEVGVKEKNK